MKIVNAYYIGASLEPLIFLDEDEIQDVDVEKEADIKVLIRKFIKPHIEKFDPKSKVIFKDSLGYFLHFGSDMWEGLFEINQPPFELPDNPVSFYRWLWEELFGDEIYIESNQSSYTVSNKFEGPNKIKLI